MYRQAFCTFAGGEMENWTWRPYVSSATDVGVAPANSIARLLCQENNLQTSYFSWIWIVSMPFILHDKKIWNSDFSKVNDTCSKNSPNETNRPE